MLPSNYLTASQTHDLVQSGTLTVEQVIGDHRARIEERDKDVLAWKCTNLTPPPPSLTKELCGITIGVKDIMSESMLSHEC
jgi:Asp-tRNA(Asn)/Glu-tRNA(Gln) amidotransferase A subunit family amidase